MVRVLTFLVVLLGSGLVRADWLVDKLVADSERFQKAKPPVAAWPADVDSYVDAWERCVGLSVMVGLQYRGDLPPGWGPGLNARVGRLRALPAVAGASDEAEDLRAAVKLFAEFAYLYLHGRVSYDTYMLVRYYVSDNVQGLAERVGGVPYGEGDVWRANR